MSLLESQFSKRQVNLFSLVLIIAGSCFPLLFEYPFRFNVFLAWEGAYRLAEGQIPYKDFALPMGFSFWVIPAAFFKIFGPNIYTLIISQVFINILSLFAFRRILQLFRVSESIIFFSLVVFFLSYTMLNLWPWYNHSVFVYELLGFNCFLPLIVSDTRFSKKDIVPLILAGFFLVFSFFTKQDTGFLGISFALSVLLIYGIRNKSFFPLLVFLLSAIVFLALFSLPFLPYNFDYWFNYGQDPHFSRFSLFDLLNEFFGASYEIKLYLLFVILIGIYKCVNKQLTGIHLYFFLFMVFILFQASVIQVTSYTPVKGNIYFHSFSFAYILSNIRFSVALPRIPVFLVFLALTGLWWSGEFWNRYIRSTVARFVPPVKDPDKVISKNTYMTGTSDSSNSAPYKRARADWQTSSLSTFHRIKIPVQTEEGVQRLMELDVFKKSKPSVLNMSELTSLTVELDYPLLKGVNQPLWYHKNVSIFDKEIEQLKKEVRAGDYDVILFQDIPGLNNFYPYEVRDEVRKYYSMQDRFLAPRYEGGSYIEVYVQEQDTSGSKTYN